MERQEIPYSSPARTPPSDTERRREHPPRVVRTSQGPLPHQSLDYWPIRAACQDGTYRLDEWFPSRKQQGGSDVAAEGEPLTTQVIGSRFDPMSEAPNGRSRSLTTAGAPRALGTGGQRPPAGSPSASPRSGRVALLALVDYSRRRRHLSTTPKPTNCARVTSAPHATGEVFRARAQATDGLDELGHERLHCRG
jgi:hypothetical protein